MQRPKQNEPPDLWEEDGSLRDVYIHDVSDAEWGALHALIERYPHEYSFDGVLAPKPEPRTIFANRKGSHLLTIIVGGARINCHYFTPSEIELDISPKEVITPETHTEVLCFLEELALATRKKISVTAENSPELVMLKFEPEAGVWSVFPAPHKVGI